MLRRPRAWLSIAALAAALACGRGGLIGGPTEAEDDDSADDDDHESGDDDDSSNTRPPVTPTLGDLLIHEVLFDAGGGSPSCDADGDGAFSNSRDEFVEIYNPSAKRLDLHGVTISDIVGVKFIFQAPPILEPDEAFVVLGATTAGTSNPAFYGGAHVAFSGGLGLNNSEDRITVTLDGLELDSVEWTGFSAEDDQSLTRNVPGLDGFHAHEPYTFTPPGQPSGSRRCSPGLTEQGEPFPGPTFR